MASIPTAITFPSSLSAITFSSTTTSTTFSSIVTAPPLTIVTTPAAGTVISSSGSATCDIGSIGLGGICTPAGTSSTATSLSPSSSSTSIILVTPTSLISFSILTATLPIPSSTLPDTTLCSVAFTSGLEYDFVASNQEVQDEIHYYLPVAIAHALNITDSSQIVMEVLSPYDTSALGYITTLAIFWVPTKFVEPLSAQISQTDSYFHTGSSDRNLKLFTGLIDPTFPLTGVIFSSEASAEPPLLTVSMTTRLKSLTTSPTTTANSTTTNSMTANLSQTTISATLPPNSDLPSETKAGIGAGVSLGVIVLLGLSAFLVLRHRKKVRPDEPKPQQELEKYGDPRSELSGNMQPVEKDGVMRNELSSDTPIWELPGEQVHVSDDRSDGYLDINAHATSRSRRSDIPTA